MTAPAQFQNKLEQTFSQLPGFIQSALRPAYTPVDDAIKWVCGDPDALVQAGQVYLQLGRSVQDVSTQVTNDVSSLESVWTDAVGQTFRARMDNTCQALTNSGQALSETDKILTAGARAAMDAANTICDIITSVVEFIIADAVIGAALTVLTLGASDAAAIVAAIAEWAEGTAEVSEVVAQIVEVLRSIEEALKSLSEIFKLLKEIFELLKQLKQDAGFLGKIGILIGKTAISKTTSTAYNAIPVLPNLPQGAVHWGTQAAGDGKDVLDDVKAMDALGKQ